MAVPELNSRYSLHAKSMGLRFCGRLSGYASGLRLASLE